MKGENEDEVRTIRMLSFGGYVSSNVMFVSEQLSQVRKAFLRRLEKALVWC